MQLPDEAITYDFKNLLVNATEAWTPAAELRHQNFLTPEKLHEMTPRVLNVRSQVVTERELKEVPPAMQPLDAGFIDLPQKLLDEHRKHGDASELGRVLSIAAPIP